MLTLSFDQRRLIVVTLTVAFICYMLHVYIFNLGIALSAQGYHAGGASDVNPDVIYTWKLQMRKGPRKCGINQSEFSTSTEWRKVLSQVWQLNQYNG